jgi:hypothetical protein
MCVVAFASGIQIYQSPAKPARSFAKFSKKKAWISFDSLVGFEPFQWVVATPWAKKYLLRLRAAADERIATEIFLFRVFGGIAHDEGDHTEDSAYPKENVGFS